MSRVPDRGSFNELKRLEKAISRVGGAVTNISGGGGGGGVSRFDFQYDHSVDGVGTQPVVGDTVYYDPLTKKNSVERYALGCNGILTNLTAGNSSRRYPLGKWDIIKTSDGKVWYVGLFNSSGRTGQNVTSPAIKIYEVVDNESGVLDLTYSAFQLGSIGSTPTVDFSMSNIVEGSTDVFGVAFGDVNTTANTLSLFKLTYTGTWSIVGGGSLSDTSMGVSHTNFDVRNGDLLYDPVQQDFLFFAVDNTSTRVAKWQESNAASLGVTTIASKAYGVDIPDRVNGFNIATRLSDGKYLVVDGTTGGSWIYDYNGSTFSATGTNNVLSNFNNGFNGIQISENAFAFDIACRRDIETVSFTLMEYDPNTITLSETQKSFTHTEIVNGKGRDFIPDQQAFYFDSQMVDNNGNSIELDLNNDIVGVTFSNGFGTADNMSVKPLDGFLYYYSDFILPSSSTSTEYSSAYALVSKTCAGNLQTDRMPIPLGRVREVSTTFPTVDCVLESVESTSLTKGGFYGDYVAISETRLIPIKKGESLPYASATASATTDPTLQAILKSGTQANDVFHDNNTFLVRNGDEQRYVFEFDKDASYTNIQMNVLVNGIPYFSGRELTVAQTYYYLDMSAAGSVYANIATSNTARAYLFNI